MTHSTRALLFVALEYRRFIAENGWRKIGQPRYNVFKIKET
jgi:hypothetical protein